QFVAAEVGAGLEAGPQTRVMHDVIVAGAEGLQLGPTVDVTPDETDGLNRLKHAFVVEIGKAAIPAPAAAGEAEFFARLHIRRDAVFHLVEIARALPEEMALAQAELGGDVADVNVENSVTVDVTEVTAHAFE